jgi:SsrA-binding protein
MVNHFIKIAVNRKAYHDYYIHETIEAGIVLKGSEIKSIRSGRVSLRDAYARPDNNELWLFNSHIAHYDAASYNSHEIDRPRKLLLHRDEITKVCRELQQSRLTLIPLSLYIKNGVAKLELGMAKGKREYDKRETITRREIEREVGRALKFKRR